MADKSKKGKHKKALAEMFGMNENSDLLDLAFDFDEKDGLDVIDTKKLKKKGKNDKQYNSLITEAKRQPKGARADKDDEEDGFDERYTGRKVTRRDLKTEDDEIIDSDEVSAEDEKNKAKHEKWLGSDSRKKKKLNNGSGYYIDEINVDELLDKIDKEDQRKSKKDVGELEDERKKSRALALQLKSWKSLLFIRYFLQKPIELAKKLPGAPAYDYFMDGKISKKQAKTEESLKFLEISILDLLEKLLFLQSKCSPANNSSTSKHLFRKNLAHCIRKKDLDKSQFVKSCELNMEALWKTIEDNFQGYYPWIEESLATWSQKTSILSANMRRSGLHNLMQTPIGQTQKAMEQVDKLVLKSQLKRGEFKILGLDEDDIHCNYNEQIYDDTDFFHELLKDFTDDTNNLESSEMFGLESDLVGGDFLIDSTKKYLQERKLKEEERAKKDVDRKASKNRKIRYDAHPKLINFMAPSENIYLMEGRDEILKTIKDSLSGRIEEKAKAKEAEGNVKTSEYPRKKNTKNSLKRQRAPSQEFDIQLL